MMQPHDPWPLGNGGMAESIRSFDWASTPLGPIARWPQSLKTIVDLMLGSPSMMSLVWGPEAIHLYNDSFTELLQEHRIVALGRSAYETFAGSRDVFEADIAAGMAGRSARLLAQRYPVLRQGHLQEAWFDVDYAPIRDEAGAVAGVLWTLKETTAQHLAEQALRASETRHRRLVESWAQAVWETDAAGAVVADSPSWRAYTGQMLEESLGHGWLDAIHPDDRAYAERQWREAVAARGLVDAEFRLRAPDGGWRWTNVRAAPMLDADGCIEKWLGLNIDIDARKRAEAALREGEERYRSLFNVVSQGLAINQLVRDGNGRVIDARFLDLNPAYEAQTGFERGRAVGRLASEIFPSVGPFWLEMAARVVETGQAERIERFNPDTGRWFAFDMAPFEGRDQFVVLYDNITDRKQAEAALRESEEKYRTLFESIDEGFCVIEVLLDHRGGPTDYVFLETNTAFERQTGLADVIGKRMRELAPDHERHWFEIYGQIAISGRPHRFEQPAEALGRWYDVYAFRIGDPEQRRVAILFNDVAERKQAERELRESEERKAFLLALSDALRPLADAGDIQATTTRLLGAHLGVDRAMYAEVTGEPGAEAGVIRGQFIRQAAPGRPAPAPFPDHFSYETFGAHVMARRYSGEGLAVADVNADPGFDAAERAAWARVGVRAAIVAPLVKGGRLVAELGVHSETSRTWTDAEVSLVREVGERTWAAVERARAEAALRESEERLRNALSISTVGVLFWGGDETIVDTNEAFLQMTGLTRAEALGMSWRELTPPEFLERSAAFMKEVEDTGQGTPYEKQYFRRDGSRWWGLFAARKLGDGFVEFVLDVTSRREAEAALRESEGRFQQFAASSSDALWMRDAATLAMEYASPAIRAIYGVPPETILGAPDRWTALIAPEDRESALRHLEQARGGEAVTHEFRIRRPTDGEVRWIRNTDFPLTDAQGRVQRIGGVAEDVTEARKMRERQGVLVGELQHRTRNLMAVVRAMADKTMARAADLVDFRARFSDRLAALARVQGLLSRLAEGERITFDALIRAEMAALDGAAEKVTLEGPEGVALRSSTVQTFALALHELATNAVKYGAFAQAQGRLEIRWRVERAAKDGRPWLHVDWRERGVVIPAEDDLRQGDGSGRELIVRALPYQLGAKTTYVLEADGVHCTIALPVSERQAMKEPVDA